MNKRRIRISSSGRLKLIIALNRKTITIISAVITVIVASFNRRKLKAFPLLMLIVICFSLIANASTFTTKQDGSYEQIDVWTPRYPGNIIKEQDTIVINNSVMLNSDLVVKGTIVVSQNGSLIGDRNIIVSKSGLFINLGHSKVEAITNRGSLYNKSLLEIIHDFFNSGELINHSSIRIRNILDNSGVISGVSGSLSAKEKIVNSQTGVIQGHLDICSISLINADGGKIETSTVSFCGQQILNYTPATAGLPDLSDF